MRSKPINIESFFFLLFIMAMPFGANSFLSFRMGGFNLTVAQLLLLLIVLVVYLKGCLNGFKMSFVFSPYTLLIILCFIFSLINLFYIPAETMIVDLKTSLHLLVAIVLFIVSGRVVHNMDCLNKVLSVLLIILVFLAILTLLKTGGVPIPGYVRKNVYNKIGIGVVALFTGIMPFSLLVAGGFPICLKKLNGTTLKSLFSGIVLLAGVVAYTRSLWVALFVQAVMAFYFQYNNAKKWYNRSVMFFFIIAILLFCIIQRNEILSFIYSIRPTTVSGRLESIFLGLDIICSDITYILFGMGEGVFLQSLFNFSQRSFVIHNFLLGLFICRGAFAAICLFSCICLIVLHLNRIRKDNHLPVLFRTYAEMFILCLIGLCAEGMFSPVIGSIIFWTYPAVACAFIAIVNKHKRIIRHNESADNDSFACDRLLSAG